MTEGRNFFRNFLPFQFKITMATAGFLLPVVQGLSHDIKTVQALILVPSRELAIQIDDVFRKWPQVLKLPAAMAAIKEKPRKII